MEKTRLFQAERPDSPNSSIGRERGIIQVFAEWRGKGDTLLLPAEHSCAVAYGSVSSSMVYFLRLAAQNLRTFEHLLWWLLVVGSLRASTLCGFSLGLFQGGMTTFWGCLFSICLLVPPQVQLGASYSGTLPPELPLRASSD